LLTHCILCTVEINWVFIFSGFYLRRRDPWHENKRHETKPHMTSTTGKAPLLRLQSAPVKGSQRWPEVISLPASTEGAAGFYWLSGTG
jgi:hypothetical protein